MKSLGCSMDFIRQRNADLWRAYHQCLARADFIVMPDIFRQVAESPASRFWVSEERATIVISAMLRGSECRCPPKRPLKKEMFQEIFRRVLLLREKSPDSPLYALVFAVVNQPAPKFYYTPRSVGEFISRIRNGKQGFSISPHRSNKEHTR